MYREAPLPAQLEIYKKFITTVIIPTSTKWFLKYNYIPLPVC